MTEKVLTLCDQARPVSAGSDNFTPNAAALPAPDNFAIVEQGVYRSACPTTAHTGFLQKLRLNSVVCLLPDGLPEGLLAFYQAQGIQVLFHGLEGNKFPFRMTDPLEVCRALRAVLEPTNRPLLLHCNKGKHRTGTLVALLRRLRGWSLPAVFDEYILYSTPKQRVDDLWYIQAFDLHACLPAHCHNGFQVQTQTPIQSLVTKRPSSQAVLAEEAERERRKVKITA